ncbi:MAG: tripartite tricarboxylate transporter permease, partial [Verrucomicrobiota bacterium]
AEAANNANAGGALVPLITIGIPGAPVDAILLGAMMIHNITPGPQLFAKHGDMVWALMGGYLIANIIMFLIMVFSTKHIAKIIKVNRAYLIPVVFVFCFLGTYSESNNIFDVWVMLCFGVFGFFLDRAKFPLGPLVIGFVLGDDLEKYLRQGLQQSSGSFEPMLTQPISLGFTLVTVAFLAFSIYAEVKRRKKEKV